MEAMAIMKEALCNAVALKTLDVSDGARQIVDRVDGSLKGLGARLQQEDNNQKRLPCRYEGEHRNKAER